MASSCDNRVEELIAERNKIGGRKFKASKPAQQAITHLCALFDQLVPYAHPAPAEQDEALNLLAHICDNLNDLPISDKWAKSIVERITAMLDARYGVRDFVRPAPAAQGWISVHDRLPKVGDMCLVWDAEFKIVKVQEFVTHYEEPYPGGGRIPTDDWFEDYWATEVEWWQPAPAAPQPEQPAPAAQGATPTLDDKKDVLLTASMAKEVASIYSSHSIEHGCGDGEREPEMAALRSLASGRTVTVPVDVLGVLREAGDWLKSVRVFVTSRERIKHPEGTAMHDELIARIDAILETPDSTREAKP